MKPFFLYIILILTIGCKSNEIKFSVAPIFSDKMVLQQNQSNSIWGTANPFSNILVASSWDEKILVKADENGNWIMNLPTPPYNDLLNDGSQTIQITNENNNVLIKDVLIGEVWLASGQSNMQWYMNSCYDCVINQDEEIEKSNNNSIRMFSVPQDLTGESLKYAKWISASKETTGAFSATAYYFAKKLFHKLGVPIGIVNTSWGGTRVEAWTSPEKLRTLKETKDQIDDDYSFKSYQDYFKKHNDSIAKVNNKKYGYKTYEVPKWTENKELWSKYENAWENLDLGDSDFKKIEFDDSLWENWNPTLSNFGGSTSNGRFEAVFEESDPLLSDGIIWYRTVVNISDPTKDYVLHVKKGIDDADQTYFNGELIGNTYNWSAERNYNIPKEIIQKGENLLSFRISDLGGGGGFNSDVEILGENSIIKVPFEDFKYKHHSFITNRFNITVHNHTPDELEYLDKQIRDDIKQGLPLNSPNGFSAMYECMLSPVMPYGIKGVIWYQGESNVENFHEYTNLFSGMIEDWRSAWSSDLPFYFAQIAPFIYDKNQSSQGLRDAQRKTLDRVKNTGMAVLLDIGEENDIHPENKKDVGERLALHALKNQYKFNLAANGPLYKNHVRKRSRIEVSFDHIADGLVSNGKLTGFEVADKDSIFYPALAKISNNKVIVSSNMVINPVHVRYGWKNWFEAKLFNSEGLPASSFSSQ
jgi:sialate O-acetylesterase